MTIYSYRSYTPGDEVEINNLYEVVTGRRRTREEYLWQWHGAPGGNGEIWLIEAEEGDGRKRLIGHHGIMPIRFTLGDNDLLCGKTENTFVHPDYRMKILYPRFESRFRSHYEKRFNALFSTMGPNAAIRQRLAQGYQASTRWAVYLWMVHCPRAISFSIKYLVRKLRRGGIAKYAKPIRPPYGQKNIALNHINITAYDSSEAEQQDIFHTFWKSIRKFYPVTPSRNYEDLKWRFWKNPYIPYTTLVLNSEMAGLGAAMLYNAGDGFFVLDDFFIEQPRTQAYGQMLNSVLQWASLCNACFVQFITTDDSVRWVGADNFHARRKYVNVQPLIDRIRKVPQRIMPRKILQAENIAGLKSEGWYVTGILSQGIF